LSPKGTNKSQKGTAIKPKPPSPEEERKQQRWAATSNLIDGILLFDRHKPGDGIDLHRLHWCGILNMNKIAHFGRHRHGDGARIVCTCAGGVSVLAVPSCIGRLCTQLRPLLNLISNHVQELGDMSGWQPQALLDPINVKVAIRQIQRIGEPDQIATRPRELVSPFGKESA
jgi:hypothetical protein